MALSTEETRHALGEFAAKWGGFEGSERAEAQTFLTQLLLDMIWPGVCIFEMKRSSEAGKLAEHREQALASPKPRVWRSGIRLQG